MAKQDQVMIDLDFSRVNELFHYMETLHTQTSEMIMCLHSSVTAEECTRLEKEVH